MDKYEYKVRADEIKELIGTGDYAQAVEIADTIDWRRVKSVKMLCTISDLYKMNRRYDEAKELLEMAYDRHPGSRTICYSLCELSIKTEDYINAFEYYKQFVNIAPRDPGRFILKYKIYVAQDVSLEERIEVLKDLKAHNEYHEKWLYELAYLYHRLGLVTECVEECDDLITMFGEGKYVFKAMELKMLHQPLTPAQQQKYDHRFDREETEEGIATEEAEYEEAEGEYGSQENVSEKPEMEESASQSEVFFSDTDPTLGDTKIYEKKKVAEAVLPKAHMAEPVGEPDINVKVMDPGYNTMNLQETVAEGIREYLGDDGEKKDAVMESIMKPMMDNDTESLDYPEIDEVSENDLEPDTAAEMIEKTEVFFGETGEISGAEEEKAEERAAGAKQTVGNQIPDNPALEKAVKEVVDRTAAVVMEQLRLENISTAAKKALEAQPPKEIASVLSQEDDGQISFIVPETQAIERQITGQLNLEDVVAEWERMKRENEEKNKEAVSRRVKEQTGEMFTEFEASLRDSILERLENGENVGDDPITDEDEVEELAEIESVDLEEAEDARGVTMQSVGSEEEDGEFFTEAVEEPEESIGMADNSEAEEETAEHAGNDGAPEEAAAEYAGNDEAAEEETAEYAGNDEAREGETGETEGDSAEGASDAAQAAEIEIDKPRLRALTREEKELYTEFIQSKSAKEQLINIIDNTTMAAYTGNIIITGDEGTNTMSLCKNIIKEVKMSDSNLSGRVAKISGKSFNSKNIPEMLEQLANGALIIQKASDIKSENAAVLYQALQNDSQGIIVILEDTYKAMDKFLEKNSKLKTCFTNRMDVQALSNDVLVEYGKQYARSLEYSIDEFGILAFHTKIEERQTLEHAVTVRDVKEIIDGAIRHANKKTLGHFFDILLAKRYDGEDMIVLGEKDFI